MSIEALNWARKTYVGDSLAKSLLRAIGDYADENGKAWPSHARLAADCEMSESTVKRRIMQLEDLGLLSTRRCWIDDRGQRNYSQRGRETSRDIVLALNKRVLPPSPDTEDEAERGGADSTPSVENEGVLSAPHGVPPAPPGGSHVTTPNSEPPLNQKDSPQAPQAGGCVPDQDQGKDSEPEHFAGFRLDYPNRELWAWDKVLPMFAAMPAGDQERARAAAPHYARKLALARQKPQRPQSFLRDRLFDNFPDARLPEKQPKRIWIPEADLAGWRVALAIADQPAPRLIDDPQHGRGLWGAAPVPSDMAALGAFAGSDVATWSMISEGSQEFGAWRDRLRRWLGVDVQARKRWLEPLDESVHFLTSPNYRARKCDHGLPVPCPWPPSKDGKVYEEERQ